MRKVGLFEAKQKLSELVERAAAGERIGITRRGKLAVVSLVKGRYDLCGSSRTWRESGEERTQSKA